MYPTPQALADFLIRAHHNTYANTNASKASPLRPGSNDYDFQEGDFAYHDTYFGGKRFSGEEVVYWKGRPIWAMNYYGRGLTDDSESFFDSILRPALMETPWAELPVRGPKHFEKGGMEYVMQIREGDINGFSADELIVSGDKLLFKTHLHGGWIE